MPGVRRSLGLVLGLLAACGSPAAEQAKSPTVPRTTGKVAPLQPGLPALEAATVTTLAAEAFGPYVGARAGARVVVWAARDKQGSAWYSSPLPPSREPLRLGATSGPLGLVAVRPAGGGANGGFVVLSTREGDLSAVEAMLLGRAGQLSGGPISVAETNSPILWVEAIATSYGTLALWAVSEQGRASLWSALIGPDARLGGEPRLVVKDVLAWQAVSAADGAMVGVVSAADKGTGAGTVQIVPLDGSGVTVGRPIVVSESPTAQADLDMVGVGERIALAWTDRRTIDATVVIAVADDSGRIVTKPEAVLPPRGEQALVRLVPPATARGPAYLAWENLSEQASRGRRILVAAVGESGKLQPNRGQIAIRGGDGGVPELAATTRGLAALTLAPACPRGSCESAEAVPTFVELAADFSALTSEPIRLVALKSAPARLAWGLSCLEKDCVALAANDALPTPVYAVRLVSRSSKWEPAGGPLELGPVPRVAALRTLSVGDELADVAALEVSKGALVATVTYFDPNVPYERLKTPAPDGRYDPVRALLQTRLVTREQPPAEPQTISLRARSVGGVDLAPGPNEGALLAWSAIDGNSPQVFLSLLDAHGGRLLQRMLTRSRGEVSDVAAAMVEGGWVVGWISERDGDPEVYAAKVDRALHRVGKEQRITNVSGTATGLRLFSQGASVLAVWSDARGPKGTSLADLFAIQLSAKDATPMGSEVQVTETRWHSHSPALASTGEGAVLAWVESTGAESEAASKGTGVRLVEIDTAGRPRGDLLIDEGASVAPGLSLSCENRRCNGIFAATTASGRELRGFTWTIRDREPATCRWHSLNGPTEQSFSSAFAGRTVFYVDLVDRHGRLMELGVDWD